MVSSKPQDRCVLPQLGHGLLPTCSSWGLCTRAASTGAGAPSTWVPSSSLGLKAEQANPWHIATDWGCAGNPLPAPRREQLPASARGRSKTSWQQPRSHSAPSPAVLAAPSPAEQELGNLSPGPLRHANPPDLLLNQMLNLLQSTCAMRAFRGAGEAAGGEHGVAPRGRFSLLVGRCSPPLLQPGAELCPLLQAVCSGSSWDGERREKVLLLPCCNSPRGIFSLANPGLEERRDVQGSDPKAW